MTKYRIPLSELTAPERFKLPARPARLTMDDSQIYDCADEDRHDGPGAPARWALILPDNRAVYCATETLAAAVQRSWRVLNGFDPMTGEPGWEGDYVLTLE